MHLQIIRPAFSLIFISLLTYLNSFVKAVLSQHVFLPSVHCRVWPALGAIRGQILSLPWDASCCFTSRLHPLQLPLWPRGRGLVHRGDIVTERSAQRSVWTKLLIFFFFFIASTFLLKMLEDYYRAKLFIPVELYYNWILKCEISQVEIYKLEYH